MFLLYYSFSLKKRSKIHIFRAFFIILSGVCVSGVVFRASAYYMRLLVIIVIIISCGPLRIQSNPSVKISLFFLQFTIYKSISSKSVTIIFVALSSSNKSCKPALGCKLNRTFFIFYVSLSLYLSVVYVKI